MLENPQEQHDLTVVIPAFNAASTIETAVRGALAAGASVVLVIDDGSEDETPERAASVGAHVVRQENAGAARARIRGLQEVSTDYVVFLDADDELVTEGVQAGLATLRSGPNNAAVAGGVICVFADGRRKQLSPWEEITTRTLLNQGFSPVPPAAIIWRTNTLRSALVEPPRSVWPRYAEDYEMLLRVSLLGPIRSLSTVSAIYALSGGKSQKAPVDAAMAAIKIANHYATVSGIGIRQRSARGARSQAYLRLATTQAGGLSKPRNVLLLLRAFAHDPAFISTWFVGGVSRKLRRSAP